MSNIKQLEKIMPVAPLKIIALEGAKELGELNDTPFLEGRSTQNYQIQRIKLLLIKLK